MEKIPEELRVLTSDSKKKDDGRIGLEVVKWDSPQRQGYISIELWDLRPPVKNNKVGPEYYLFVSKGKNIRRGDVMNMARRGRRNELRHYFTCDDPAYGKKVCASVAGDYPGVWTTLSWKWDEKSMDFRVNGQSAKNSPTLYYGQIKHLWIPGGPNAERNYRDLKWRGLVIMTPDKPREGGLEFWKPYDEDPDGG